MRSTTRLPSGATAPPVIVLRPGAWNRFGVPVSGGSNSPTFSSGTPCSGGLFGISSVGTYNSAGPAVLVTIIGMPSPSISNASASRGCPSG